MLRARAEGPMDTGEENFDELLQSTGIWVGERYENQIPEGMVWNLTITPNTPYPSVFGAAKDTDVILHGR